MFFGKCGKLALFDGLDLAETGQNARIIRELAQAFQFFGILVVSVADAIRNELAQLGFD